MELYRYTFKEFLTKDIHNIEDYITIFKLVEPIPSVGKKVIPLHTFSFIDVRTIMDYLCGKREVTPDFIAWVVGKVSETEESHIFDISCFDVFACYNHIGIQIGKFIDNENAVFSVGEGGGSEELKTFGVYNEIDLLSGGDATKWEQAMNLPYWMAFKKLHLSFTVSLVEKRMMAKQKE